MSFLDRQIFLVYRHYWVYKLWYRSHGWLIHWIFFCDFSQQYLEAYKLVRCLKWAWEKFEFLIFFWPLKVSFDNQVPYKCTRQWKYEVNTQKVNNVVRVETYQTVMKLFISPCGHKLNTNTTKLATTRGRARVITPHSGITNMAITKRRLW